MCPRSGKCQRSGICPTTGRLCPMSDCGERRPASAVDRNVSDTRVNRRRRQRGRAVTSPSSLGVAGRVSTSTSGAGATPARTFQLRDAEAVLDASGPPFTFITRPRGGRKSTDAAGYAVALHLTARAIRREELRRSRPTPNRLAWSSTPSAASCAARPSSDRGSRSRLAAVLFMQGGEVHQLLRGSAGTTRPARYGLRPYAVICRRAVVRPDSGNARGLWSTVVSAMPKVRSLAG